MSAGKLLCGALLAFASAATAQDIATQLYKA